MDLQTYVRIRKWIVALLVIASLVSFMGMGNQVNVQAQDDGPNGDYYTETMVTLKDGNQLKGLIIHGPPHPPRDRYGRRFLSLRRITLQVWPR
jgi:hypothetical protein